MMLEIDTASSPGYHCMETTTAFMKLGWEQYLSYAILECYLPETEEDFEEYMAFHSHWKWLTKGEKTALLTPKQVFNDHSLLDNVALVDDVSKVVYWIRDDPPWGIPS